MIKKPIIQDGNEFYQDMTAKEYIHQLKMALVHANEAQKLLRESIEGHLGYSVANTEKLLISSQVISVPQELYQFI